MFDHSFDASKIWRRSLAVAAIAMASSLAAAADQRDTAANALKSGSIGLPECEQTDSSPLVVRACSVVLKEKLEPKERARILVLRGRAWIMEEELESAAEDFSNAIVADASNRGAFEGRAKAYTKLGEHARAAADWTSLIALDPANDLYYRNRGYSNLGARIHDDAFADFDMSIKINPAAVDAYIGRAAVYADKGDKAGARKEFDRGIAVDPRYLMIYWERARIEEAWGESEHAIKDYEMVLRINGHFAHARKALIRLGIMHPP